MDIGDRPPPLVRPLDRRDVVAAPAAPCVKPKPVKPKPARQLRVPRRRPIVLAAALAAALVLIVLTWFLVVRDPGNPFKGTWAAPAGAPISGRVVASGPGRHIEVTFAGHDASGAAQAFTVRAHKDGDELVVTAEDFADAAGDVADAQRVRDTFAAFVKDFRLVFARQDPTHLRMTVEGTFVGVIEVSLDERAVVLTKVD